METNDLKILIVEDELSIREEYISIMGHLGLNLKNQVKMTGYAEEAISIIYDFDPNVILLDLKIPYNRTDNVEDIKHSTNIIREIKNYNRSLLAAGKHIYIIAISGNVKDKGIQSKYIIDRDEVFEFIDKGDTIKNSDLLKQEFLKVFNKIKTHVPYDECVKLILIQRARIKGLNNINPFLWEKIDKHIFGEFEKLTLKNTNEYTTSQGIISRSGEIVEDIIALFNDNNTDISAIKYLDNPKSVRSKLTKLTGRRYTGKEEYDDVFEIIGNQYITRKASHYAYNAYNLRSEASHSKITDPNNSKLFYKTDFTKEDAAISIHLIIPLVLDFINHFKKI